MFGNCHGHGIQMSNAKVELMDVALKGWRLCAFFIPDPTSETTLVATRCEFANSEYGATMSFRQIKYYTFFIFFHRPNRSILSWQFC